MPKPELLVSTDIVGAFGNPNWAKKLYPFFAQNEQLSVELLAWKYLAQYPDLIEKSKLSVVGIHGPTGSPKDAPSLIEKSKAIIIDQLTADLELALSARPELFDHRKRNYFLVHEPELRTKEKVSLIAQQPIQTHVLVENVLDIGSLDKTVEKIKLLQHHDVSAGIMLDLVHLLKELTQSLITLQTLDAKVFGQVWRIALAKIQTTISGLPRSGLHIPIGENGDSLPLHLMTDHHWQDLAQVIGSLGENIQWLVFENQQKKALVTHPKDFDQIAERNKRITGQIAENGIF